MHPLLKGCLGTLSAWCLVQGPPAFAKTPKHHSHAHQVKKRSPARTHVKSYTKNGKHVDAHDRSHADGSKSDNWSSKGRVNPDTGVPGTKSVE